MAPSAIYEEPVAVNPAKSGQALEAMSDKIDAVNVLKAKAGQAEAVAWRQQQQQADGGCSDEKTAVKFDSASKFDSDKDKAQFRQYEDACDRVKAFYREQHTKQTVAYNLR